jgi:acetylserotonin N-methyltransferase
MNHEPEAKIILDLIEAFRRSKVMFTAVRLGVFDQLAAAPQSSAALSVRLSADRGALSRLLDGCVALGLLERQGEVYANTVAAGRFLTSA